MFEKIDSHFQPPTPNLILKVCTTSVLSDSSVIQQEQYCGVGIMCLSCEASKEGALGKEHPTCLPFLSFGLSNLDFFQASSFRSISSTLFLFLSLSHNSCSHLTTPSAIEGDVCTTIMDELSDEWRRRLVLLHSGAQSGQYRAAMLFSNDDNNAQHSLNHLLPGPIDILTSKTRPDEDAILALPWVDTTNPGNYGCLGRKWNSKGDRIDTIMKIGGAWSYGKGLKARRAKQEEDLASKR